MKIIIQIKEGWVSNIIVILFILILSGFLIWFGITHDHLVLYISPIFCGAWLFICYTSVQNIRHPKQSSLVIVGDCLVWTVRAIESGVSQEGKVALKSIVAVEFILPKMRYEKGARNYPLARAVIVERNGRRHELPSELWPGVYQKQITTSLKESIPGIQVSERID